MIDYQGGKTMEIKELEKKMNISFIKKLAEMMTMEGMRTLEFTDGVSSIKMERDFTIERTVPVKVIKSRVIKQKEVVPPQEVVPPLLPEVVVPPVAMPEPAPAPKPASPPLPQREKILEIRSPLAGKFEKEGIEVGQFVWVDDVLGTIDDGEQLNEIASIVDGEVLEISVADGDDVAFDQVLFKLRAK